MFIFLLFFLASPVRAANVMFVGDSHSVGPFGWEFDRLTRLLPEVQTMSSYASCGSIAKWWVTGQKTPCGYWQHVEGASPVSLKTAPTPIFTDLLKTHKPDVIVVELSGNYSRLSDRFAIDDMRSMAQTIKATGAKCLWITTPKTRTDADRILYLPQLVHEAVGDVCEVFESHQVTEYPATEGDGIHYWFPAGMPIARSWAKAAVERLATLLRD